MYNPAATTIFKRTILNKKGVLIIIVFFIAVILGFAIAYERWIYMGAIVVPFLLYCCIEKPFIFPFGAYVFLIPFDSVLSVIGSTTGTTVTKLLGIMTILVLFLKGLFEEKLIKPASVTIWFFLLITYGLLSAWWAIEPELVFSLIPTGIGLLLLYLITASYQIQKSEFEMLKGCMLAGGFVAALYTVYNYTTGYLFYTTGRASLMLGERITNPNDLAYSLIIPASICIHMIQKRQGTIMRILFCIILGVIIFSIMLTGSRGGAFGVLTIAFVYILLTKQRFTFAVIFFITGIVLIQYAPEVFFERIYQGIESKGSGRTHIIVVGLKALEKYWLTGAGLGNFTKAFGEFSEFAPSYLGSGMGAHNILLGTFVELGVIGFALLTMLFVKHYKTISAGLRQRSDEDIMLKAAFWGIMVTSFFLDPMFLKSFWLLWIMILMKGNLLKKDLLLNIKAK